MTPITAWLGAIAAAAAAGCACDASGYPALEVVVTDAVSGLPIPFAGSTFRVARTSDPPGSGIVDTGILDGRNSYSLCCVSGSFHVYLKQQGYVALDTTVVIHTSGHCDRPDLERLAARLQRE